MSCVISSPSTDTGKTTLSLLIACWAFSKGIKIHIAHSSSLLDMNVPADQKLYGYHRLDDPLVSTATNGSMLITKKSKLEPPEPLDSKPNLIGREDIPGVSYEKEEK